eukprot:TRINITY_DN4518_c0_g1_i1.p1 TRINITY_DN4518_c0_g1~~TRINITY_DN4518_c0_g1_i1.p1  ORF type:complete len:294 (+),score=38.36 TRINITY_DN4518_c0_g1_i1:95-883(+)
MCIRDRYLGGESTLIHHLELKGKIRHPWPLTDSMRPISLNRAFYRRVKQGVLQFVLIKPITAVLALILHSQNVYNEGHLTLKSGYLYCSLINNISVSVSLYCLVLFYVATEERLEDFKPFGKFLVIKSIIFFSFWQSIFISILLKLGFFGLPETKQAESIANFYQDFIICLEMVIAAIAHSRVFSYQDFVDINQKPKPILTNLSTVLNVGDVIDDAKHTFIDQEKQYDMPLQDLSPIKDYWLNIDFQMEESTKLVSNGRKYH